MATRAYVEARQGKIVKGSGRFVDESLLGGGRVVQGFTGEQISYLRELNSHGADPLPAPIAQRALARPVDRKPPDPPDTGGWQHFWNTLITPLGRAAVAQLF